MLSKAGFVSDQTCFESVLDPLAPAHNRTTFLFPAAVIHTAVPRRASRGRDADMLYRHTLASPWVFIAKFLLLLSKDEERFLPKELSPIFPGPSFD